MSNFSISTNMCRAQCLAILTVFAMNHAAAQSDRSDPFPNKSAATLMRSYNNGVAGSVNRQELLIGVLNKRLPLSDTNLQTVRQSLAKASAIDEKILLMKVLASMYTPRVRSRQNLLIESDIKKLIDSADRRVAVEAVMEYSRLSYPSDRYQVLQRARSAKVIDDDAYFGELAHGLRFSSAAQQSEMLSEIEGARNRFGNEVLAATFGNQELFVQLDPSAQVKLFKFLSSREPDFPLALDSFGVIDMARYVFWMNAVTTMESKLSGKPYAELVLARLSGPLVDPRKILAVFSNPEGQRVLRETNDVNQLRKLLSRAQDYSSSLPQNPMLNAAAGTFSKQMVGVPAGAN